MHEDHFKCRSRGSARTSCLGATLQINQNVLGSDPWQMLLQLLDICVVVVVQSVVELVHAFHILTRQLHVQSEQRRKGTETMRNVQRPIQSLNAQPPTPKIVQTPFPIITADLYCAKIEAPLRHSLMPVVFDQSDPLPHVSTTRQRSSELTYSKVAQAR